MKSVKVFMTTRQRRFATVSNVCAWTCFKKWFNWLFDNISQNELWKILNSWITLLLFIYKIYNTSFTMYMYVYSICTIGIFFQMLQLHFGTEILVCQIILFDFNFTYFTCKSRCLIEWKMIITVLLYHNNVINLNERKKFFSTKFGKPRHFSCLKSTS